MQWDLLSSWKWSWGGESYIYSVFYRGSFQNTPLGLQTETETKKIAWLAKSSFAPEVRIFLLATMLARNVVIRKKPQP